MSTREHGLGRLHAPDERDRRFLMRDVVFPHEALPPRPRKRPYNLGPTLDQGSHPHCVGYACRDKIASAPLMYHTDQGPDPVKIYVGAQQHDEWPGDAYDGSSVRGGFKFLQTLGYVESYVWAGSIAECERFIREGYGTIVLGTNWYDGMFDPGADGFVHPTGWLAGGHAYHLFWMIPEKQEAWCKNSWGAAWGVPLHGRPGCFKVSYADLDRLLREDGEAGAALEVKVR